jgi:hypothetical protein
MVGVVFGKWSLKRWMWGMDTIQHWRKTKCLIEFFEHVSM